MKLQAAGFLQQKAGGQKGHPLEASSALTQSRPCQLKPAVNVIEVRSLMSPHKKTHRFLAERLRLRLWVGLDVHRSSGAPSAAPEGQEL